MYVSLSTSSGFHGNHKAEKRSISWFYTPILPPSWSSGRRNIPYINKPCVKNCRVEIGNTTSGGAPWASAMVWKHQNRQMFLDARVDHKVTMSYEMWCRQMHPYVSGKEGKHCAKPWWQLTHTTMDISHSLCSRKTNSVWNEGKHRQSSWLEAWRAYRRWRWLEGARERLRGLPLLSRMISRMKAKRRIELLKCKEKYGKEHKTIEDFFPRRRPQHKQCSSKCPLVHW